LSVRQVLAAGDGDHADGGGLALRVGAGRASWTLRYTAPSGRRREMGLGLVHRVSLAQAGESLSAARDLAHKARELLRQGVDPLDAKDQRRREARAAEQAAKAQRQVEHWTLARAARDYHERVIEPSRTTKHAAQWIASLENHMPAELWHKPIADVTAPELLRVLRGIKPHERAIRSDTSLHETVRRIRQRLESVFEDAIFHGRASLNPAAAVKRKLREAAPKKPAKGQFAALSYREAPAFMARLRAVPGIAARALEFAVLTAARTGEVLGATWAEIDLEEGLWTVPAERMKAGEMHTVRLSPRALEVVKVHAGLDPVWVFPSPAKAEAPLSNMAMLTTLGRLGARDRTTVHGLCRSTFSTWANETAAARPDVVEACLAHREGDRIRAAYNRASFDAERAELLIKWADYLAHSADVIRLGGRAA
jgi:integrase